eukprot:TRINITY_DN2817_c0_g1_i1.p1 TRINITY_DN2817_c0_g1~~TRINITY_DN2817_c0_g1_i1.p1  ORF type:complete len:397 (-),score=36.35 TRINITY_DN2817_c0_g1_i1:13-1203(-)
MSGIILTSRGPNNGRVAREENARLLRSVSDKHAINIDTVLLRNETVEWIRTLSYWQNIKHNPMIIMIWVMEIALLGVVFIEPPLLHAKWNLQVALLPLAFFMIPFIILVHKKGAVHMITNYRVITVDIGRSKLACHYIFIHSLSKIEVKGNTVHFSINKPQENVNTNNRIPVGINFKNLEDPENVRQICQNMVDNKALVVPSSVTLTGDRNRSDLSTANSNLLQQYLSSRNDSVACIYIANFMSKGKVIIISSVITGILMMWMFVFIAWGQLHMILFFAAVAIGSTVLSFFYVTFLMGYFDSCSVLTENNVLQMAKGLAGLVAVEGKLTSGFNYLLPKAYKDLGVMWSYHNVSSSTAGSIMLRLPALATIESDDILQVEEYIFSRVVAQSSLTTAV